MVGYFLGRNNIFDGNTTDQNTIVIENINNSIKKNGLPDRIKKVKTNFEIGKSNNNFSPKLENEVVLNSTNNNNTESDKKSINNSNNPLQDGVPKTTSDLKNKYSNAQNINLNKDVLQTKAISSDGKDVDKNSIYKKFQAIEEVAFQEKKKSTFNNTMKLADELIDKNLNDFVIGIANNKNHNTSVIANQPIVLKNKIIKKLDSTSIAYVETNALEKLLNEKEKKSDLDAEQKLNRWQVSTNAAPIYFGSLTDGSPIDAKLESNQKSYNTSVSVGVGVQYAVNKKLKIRTGINNLSLDYNTNDIRFTQTAEAKTLQNVDPNLAGKLLEVKTIAEIPKGFTLVDVNNELKVFNGSINQKLGYFEVPMELSYSVLNQKLGVEVLGGFSTMFLSQNEVNIISNGLDMSIGEANNLNSIHFSGNLGLGIKFGIWKKLEARIEPVFKYQFNTFSNNDGNFRPYVFGVYSGFSYTF